MGSAFFVENWEHTNHPPHIHIPILYQINNLNADWQSRLELYTTLRTQGEQMKNKNKFPY